MLAAGNVVLLSVPTYSLGFLFLIVFAYRLNWAPLGGGASTSSLVLPALTLGLFGVPYYTVVVSEATRTALSSPYVQLPLPRACHAA